MWKYNNDLNKWYSTEDVLPQADFDYTTQELSATRYYSKCLSGASYIPVNSLDDLYDVIGEYKERNWYVGLGTSNYSNYLIPSRSPVEINDLTFSDYYEKYLSDYGMTLKTLFTPNRLIKDQLSNFVYVDVATVTSLDDLAANYTNLVIDGARLKEGHKVLIKDQITTISLLNTVDPNTFFIGTYSTIANFGASIEYSYYNETNGIYKFTNSKLVREPDLDDYENCKRYSVVVKEGISNRGKQFHLNRLLSGYFPSTSIDEPIYFTEKKNWIVRNSIDYNNLFEINYYDVIKSSTQSYTIDSVTYSIPQRTISVGEFGIILNNQEGYSNIINNKYTP